MPDANTAASDPAPQTVMDWYKDAVIYQLHIKAFYDSDNDGVGDFTGLTEKLDYIKDLGVNTIWLLPFYPLAAARRWLRYFRLYLRQSHLRDDGRLSALYKRSACARPESHYRTGHQPHLRPAPVVQARAGSTPPDRRHATGTSGATPTPNMPARASFSRTPKNRTGPGIPSPRRITGTASSRTSRT